MLTFLAGLDKKVPTGSGEENWTKEVQVLSPEALWVPQEAKLSGTKSIKT